MEDLILEEIHQLSDYLDKQTDHPMKINLIFNLSVVNALWTLITGEPILHKLSPTKSYFTYMTLKG